MKKRFRETNNTRTLWTNLKVGGRKKNHGSKNSRENQGVEKSKVNSKQGNEVQKELGKERGGGGKNKIKIQ